MGNICKSFLVSLEQTSLENEASLYRLVSFRRVLEVVFLMFVKSKPDHDVQLGLNCPPFRTIATFAWKLKKWTKLLEMYIVA